MKDKKENPVSPASINSTINLIKFMVGIILFVFTLGFYLSSINHDISDLARSSKIVSQDNRDLNKAVKEKFKCMSENILSINKWIQGAEIRFLQVENRMTTLRKDFTHYEENLTSNDK